MLKLNFFGRGRSLRVAITMTCQISFIFFGYDQGVFSGIFKNPHWVEVFNNPSSALEGIIVSIYNLGGVAGCILSFFLGEKCGRRLAIWIAMGWITVGAILQSTSYSLPQILIARFVTGIGTGVETSTVPMYQSELCSHENRGRLVSSEPLFVGVGIVISYFFDYGMSFIGGPTSWRVPIACQIFFVVVVVIMVLGVPESPRWLYYHGRSEEAMQVLCDVWDASPEDEYVKKTNKDIIDTIVLEEKHGKYRFRDLLKRDRVQTGRRVLLAWGMQFMNQMGGINLVVYYVPSALQETVGLTHNLSLLIGGAVQCMFFVGSLVPTFLLDKMGRRRPMMWGSLGLAISMMMISILLSFTFVGKYSQKTQHDTGSASIAFFFTYMLIFGATANCVPWVYVPEILPLHARAKGTAIGISSNWLWNFFIVVITPTLISSLKWAAYFVFMALNLSFIPTVYFFYPETARLTLEEIDYLFTKEGNKGAKPLFKKSQPVLESLKPKSQIREDIERNDTEMLNGAVPSERKDEMSEDEHKEAL